jgi:hypothetical protein
MFRASARLAKKSIETNLTGLASHGHVMAAVAAFSI